ncbi:MAG: type II toxin-antitoxin system RelE/ParE family toxin [Fimbriimonadaceae bacterium]
MFATERLAKSMNDGAQRSHAYGTDMAKQIQRRLDDFDAAATLDDMRHLAGRCEELSGDRAGELSVRLTANYRLIFIPNHDPTPTKPDGGLDWTQVTSIQVKEVVDYH